MGFGIGGGEVPGYALSTAGHVDVSADGETWTDAPEGTAEGFAAGGSVGGGFVEVGVGRGVGDEYVGIEGDVIPEFGEL